MRTRFILFFCFVFAALLAPIATPAQQNITCESNDGGRKHCGPANPGQVTLQRQISGTECIQDRTWGVDDRGIWVDHGCRAEFQIGGNNGGYNGGNNGNNGGGPGATIKCESNDGNRKYCGQVDPQSQVTIQQQISGTPCEQGRSWGVDNRGLWVDRGCRAIFATGGGYDDGGNDGNGRDHERGPGFGPALTDYPRVRADSSGHGTFSGGNYGSNNVTRGWFDTREGRPTVSLSGSHDFKVTFFGDITRVDDRHITMRIKESSQGPARGRAEIFLNHDRNEIESISISGRDFNGDFSRR